MKMIFNTRLLSIICLVITITFAGSCKKDDDTNTGKVELLSFGPAGVKHGEDISFIGKNLDKVTAIELTGATVPKSAFKQQTSELIVLTVPQSTVRGVVTLKTPDGDIVSKAPIDFEIPVKITAISSTVKPGENVTITGDFMNWVTSVTFSDGLMVKDTGFVSKSLTQLVVKVPMAAKTGTLILTGAGTKPLTIETTTPLNVTLPAITGISPNPIKHADNLTITGTNLDLVRGVVFTGVTAEQTVFVSKSATQIVVKVPAAAQTGKISVVAYSGVAVQSSNDLTVLLPAVTAVSPNPVLPETNITITGTNLDLVTGISFTGIANPVTTFVSKTANQIVVKVPAGTLKGKLILSVLNSTRTVETTQILDLIGGLPPLAAFPHPIYTDSFTNGWQDWSWATRDVNSTANVREGLKSIKATFTNGGYEGITFHAGTAVSTSGYTKLEFSVFGETGTGGQKLNVVVNGGWSNPPQVTITQGEWTTYSLTMATLGNPATINEIVLQSAGFPGTIHIDHVGLR